MDRTHLSIVDIHLLSLFDLPADYLFSTSSTNADVFVGVIEPMVESCKNGFDTTIFTYGEKASGE